MDSRLCRKAETKNTGDVREDRDMTFEERLKQKLKKQGEKIDLRYKDRPISKEKYVKVMIFIAALILVYLLFATMCVMKVIGEWMT